MLLRSLAVAAALIVGGGVTARADIFTFETPSENIQCSVGLEAGGSDIMCTIIDRQGPPALPRPYGCNAAWGHDFEMNNRGLARMTCGPLNTNRDGYDRANYGVTGRFGGFVCQSERTGLTCWNEDGHGFFLSRREQRVF